MGETRKIIISTLKRNKYILFIILLFNFLASLSFMLQPIAFQRLFDESLPDQNLSQSILLVIVIVFIPVIFALFNSATIYFNNSLGNRLAKELRMRTFERILYAKLPEIDKIGKGETINRITQQIGQLCTVFIVNTFMTFVTNAIMLVVTIGIMFTLSIPLTMSSLIAFPLLMILMRKFRSKTGELESHYYKVLDKGLVYLNDFFRNIKTVHIFNGQQKEKETWSTWNDDVTEINKKSAVFHETYLNFMSDIIVSIMMGIVYVYSLYLVFSGELTIGTILAFIVILPRLFSILKVLFTTNIDMERMNIIERNIDEVLNIECIESGSETMIGSITPRITMQNVRFYYENNNAAGLKNIDLTIEPGSLVGIVGVSGSGKSTIFELLHRHIEPLKGSITLNGTPIENLDIHHLREIINYTPQAHVLWNETIMDNIIYPLKEAELSQSDWNLFKEITVKTQVDPFVKRLPAQYDTVIKNNGNNLSGGEIQRIILARTFMHKSSILLLDEFTSALDAMTESELNKLIMEYKGAKTIIIIAHRISTIKRADEIIVFEDGEVCEKGTMEDLLALKGVFYKLYEQQKI
ncbi:ABC transporter ATP-binding protein [Alkalicoccobacillus porphyridii]|uniref:ABC transporter ATP-binding protein n=1 Tax=Alkalicoccobacillus porphyridii TaxID=2597270 RepID=A0A553ZX46_9BACI|nr:ABC transporter ATP-binding protein [Alkalicoccobacillus porphyridii]TSB45916.1 ABC transporter ATP-binding protein [Alkalicoccobacillus porphyridii]